MVPDELFDEQLPGLSGAELKALLYIIRRTFGFKKNNDNISLNQLLTGITTKSGKILDRGTGLSRSALVSALKGLVNKNLIIAERRGSLGKGNESTNYRLNVLYPPSSKIELGGFENQTSLVRKSNPQETVLQETVLQDPSNIRMAPLSKEIEPEREAHVDNVDKSTPPAGFKKIETVLQRDHPRRKGQDHSEERDIILAYMEDFSPEFNDQASLKSSTTRALNLLQRSGLTRETFIAKLYEARSITKERTAVIRSEVGTAKDRSRRKNRMAYFFGVVEDLLGLKQDSQEQPPDSRLL